MKLSLNNIRKQLKNQGLWKDSIEYSVIQLVQLDELINSLIATVKKEGYSQTVSNANGNIKIASHPLLAEISKLENVKARLLDSLLLTPSSLKKADIPNETLDDQFDDIPKT